MRKADEPEGKTFTYQARVPVDAGAAAALDACAELFGRVERTLFAQATAQGVKPEKLKNGYLKRFGITARQFNAVRIGLDGKTDSVKERRADQAAPEDAPRGHHGFRAGIDVIAVNPAYTSVIGAVNHAARLGISVHAAAAFAIARRGLGLKERPFAAYRSTAPDCQHGIAPSLCGRNGRPFVQANQRPMQGTSGLVLRKRPRRLCLKPFRQ